jgi:uncharacterized alkaline shock family protein YloU
MTSRPFAVGGPHGRIEIAGHALDVLVGGALEAVEGAALAAGRKPVEVVSADGGLHVDLSISVGPGQVLPDVGEAAQRAVAAALRAVTGRPADVDVAVVAVHR